MREFRTGSSRVLVSTDLLCRGIDVYQVSHVINYDLPSKKESYVHRIGRTGRYGKKGLAINLVIPTEARQLIEIEKHYDTKIVHLPMDLSELETL